MACVPPKQKKQYQQPSNGIHRAVCCDVEEPWQEVDPFKTDEERTVTRVHYLTDENDKDGKPITIAIKCRFSVNDAATLFKHIQATTGDSPNEEEGYETERMVGGQVLLQTEQSPNPKTGIVYARITNIMPAPAPTGGERVEIPVGYQRVKDRPAKSTKPNGQASQTGHAKTSPRVPEKKSLNQTLLVQ